MSDPILPAPVQSRYRTNNNATSSITFPWGATQAQLTSPEESGEKRVTGSGVNNDDGGDDVPYEYPATYPPKFPVGSYLSYVKRVATNSPMLQAVFRPCLNPDKVDVMILDIKEDWTCSVPYIFGDSSSIDQWFGPDPDEPRGKKLGYSALRAFLELPKPADVFARLFLVEDLSPAVIEALGSTLNLHPDFFAEQLVGANYTLEGHKDLVEIRDALPTMPFLMKPKTFFSSTWKRSALYHDWEGNGPLNKSRTASDSNFIEKPETDDAHKDHQYNNMHRPLDAIGEHVVSTESKTVVAVEERMTFLRNDDDYGWTGVFLFDPVIEAPGSKYGRYNLLNNYNYRNIQPTPFYLDFDGPSYAPEYVNDPRTRNQFAKFITKIKETIVTDSVAPADGMNMGSSTTFLNLLFHFMVNDWTSVLREMGKFLDEVDTLLSDNDTLQKKLVTWRIILGSWRKNLVDDSEKIRTTLVAVKQQETTKQQLGGSFSSSLNELLNHVESLKDRTERTFGALMSSMAIVESQRAISQAESISRLTELAFLFIPLGFAASFFGMQLQGWTENYKPSQFAILSICLVVGSYGFRIIVRSRASRYAIENVPDKIRNNSRIPPGAHIPTLDYLAWFVATSWKVVLLVTLSVMSLALIWTLGRSKAIKIGATIMVCLLLGVGLAVTFYISRRRRLDRPMQLWLQLQNKRRQTREATTTHAGKIV